MSFRSSVPHSDLDDESAILSFGSLSSLQSDYHPEEAKKPEAKEKPFALRIEERAARSLFWEFISTTRIVFPTAITYGSDYFVTIIQLIFVGHLGSVELAGAALGSSFCNVTGFSVCLGLLSALDTLTAQAYGAKKLKKVGEAVQQSMIVLFFVSILVLPLWLLSGEVLLLLGQDPDVVEYAALYIRVTWFALFPTSIYSVLRSYMQNQNIVVPAMMAGIVNVLVTTLSLYLLLNVAEYGFVAVPISQVISACTCLLFMFLYIVVCGYHKPTWTPFSFSCLKGIRNWLELAIPGMTMRCAEWWCFEINIIVSGLLSVNSLDAMTLLFNVMNFLYCIPMSFSIAAAAKVGNAVGANDIGRARRISWLILVASVFVQSIVSLVLFLTQDHWPLVFTKDDDVSALVIGVIPLLSGFCIIDAAQTALGGILRGAGKQKIGAAAYLFSYYPVGMSIGIPLALCTDLGIMGLWIGITSAAFTSLCLLSLFYFFMRWKKVIFEAQDRLRAKKSLIDENEETQTLLDEEFRDSSIPEQFSNLTTTE